MFCYCYSDYSTNFSLGNWVAQREDLHFSLAFKRETTTFQVGKRKFLLYSRITANKIWKNEELENHNFATPKEIID